MKLFHLISPAYAQGIVNNALPQLGTGEGETIFGNLITGLISLAIVVGVIAALIFLILGAIRWITSSGDKNQLQQAQQTITSAVIGLIILAAVFAIMVVVSTFLGLGTSGPGGINLPIPKLTGS